MKYKSTPQKPKSQKQARKKDSFSMYFALLRPTTIGLSAFFFIASFIYRYSSLPQSSTTVLGVQTSTNSIWVQILNFFTQFFR